MKNLSVRSQNLMMILFLLLINILAFMSVDTTDNEWIILFASSVFFMDFIIITMLIMFFIVYVGSVCERL
ncbi:hypothetical protein CSQ14_004520 [Salmonella enterica subsp. diarizonae]|uniref:Uncharacterized protein n=1 Tax=Salmonella diarizonae TaxID=59204 RepID=A0A702D6M0_SALDZ|nr:hypothetical protein [Salmonella enterica subsp. enterica]EAZ0650153.1 hypothetical protein [Salmonella enterica]ECE6696963.1 hypothetical protein [Salmonella enterica subsp. diarizonae]ECS6775135.1 hypothetical protein [Salmonella enterica subsp. diarizonae serovar 65:z10:e,n,x,z15]EBA5368673.1 hypothetical protein [Salmonella enterica]